MANGDGNGATPFSDCPVPIGERDEIVLGHGSGGKLSARLLETLILPAFGNPALADRDRAVREGSRAVAAAARHRQRSSPIRAGIGGSTAHPAEIVAVRAASR
jgi:hypothetical protein